MTTATINDPALAVIIAQNFIEKFSHLAGSNHNQVVSIFHDVLNPITNRLDSMSRVSKRWLQAPNGYELVQLHNDLVWVKSAFVNLDHQVDSLQGLDIFRVKQVLDNDKASSSLSAAARMAVVDAITGDHGAAVKDSLRVTLQAMRNAWKAVRALDKMGALLDKAQNGSVPNDMKTQIIGLLDEAIDAANGVHNALDLFEQLVAKQYRGIGAALNKFKLSA